MGTVARRIQDVVGHRLVRAPDFVLRHLTVRRPTVVDGLRLEPRTQHALAVLARSGQPPLESQPVPDARRDYGRLPLVFEGPPRPMARVEDRQIDGPAGPLAVRIYRPRLGDDAEAVLLYFHGGGGVIGDLDTHDGACRILAEALDHPVISVDYRLAPEHPFPAAPEDALAAFRWVRRSAESLRVDPARISVGGDSMGGNLAAVVCQLTRDAGEPMPCAQMLLYPGTDRVGSTRSRELFGEGFLLTEPLLQWFTRLYLGGADPHDPRVSPARHENLADLPPALVVTAGFDPLRDEGRAYADGLRAAGTTVRYRCHEGLIHGFAQLTGAVPAGRDALLEAADDLRALCSSR